MPGFKRDETKDTGGYRGLIPEGETVGVVSTSAQGKLLILKTGENAGKSSRLYNLCFEVLQGKFKGAFFYHDLWCNVQPDPAGGDPEVFGSHMQFCDFCDAGGIFTKESQYPVPDTKVEVEDLAATRMVGIPIIATVGVTTYKNKHDEDVKKNFIKNIHSMNAEQRNVVAPRMEIVVTAARARIAKKRAAEGATGLEGADLGLGLTPDDDDDMPF